MAKHFDLIERDGRQVKLYDSHAELDAATGKIIKRASRTALRPNV